VNFGEQVRHPVVSGDGPHKRPEPGSFVHGVILRQAARGVRGAESLS
jgi:hypothetical protein